ncbi:uncharacterized protein LOC130784589 isoform X2 [Actinidia eriantha]|uniref:uncharacterized protein LOC130784589 isoform X2 n=1 Tax=Actinidia eriantha TaxID=165200 RepID=UPI00258A7C8A|nr:uncharacterized protein LOC130784589 isoform X2 [Actinidia eriantha]
MSFELMVHAIVALLGGYKDNMSGIEDVKAHEEEAIKIMYLLNFLSEESSKGHFRNFDQNFRHIQCLEELYLKNRHSFLRRTMNVLTLTILIWRLDKKPKGALQELQPKLQDLNYPSIEMTTVAVLVWMVKKFTRQ